MRYLYVFAFLCFTTFIHAQSGQIKGQLQDTDGNPVVFANAVLYQSADSTLAKVATTDDAGLFQIPGIADGNYYLEFSYVGLPNLIKNDLQISGGNTLDLEVVQFDPAAVELQQATVTASRALVEIKPDRTVFNVEGTINSVGSNAIELLRKAPGVLVDNNNGINLLGRSGVRIFVDGKQIPLSGDELNNYLQNIPAEQIDRIDIITNPGARYEAEGNAGIIDIRLKKNKNFGANGTVNGTFTRGKRTRYNLGATGNYRNKFLNVFGNLGYGDNEYWNDMTFLSFQNGLQLDEINTGESFSDFRSIRIGTDFYLNKNHTIGFLTEIRDNEGGRDGFNRIEISQANTPENIDSILVATNQSINDRDQQTFNLNYRYDNREKNEVLNVDLDYGRYRNEAQQLQPNVYTNEAGETLTTITNSFDTPRDIDIYTFQLDYEKEILGGKLGAGSKLSRVVTDNVFDVYINEIAPENLDISRSNVFEYEENVYAGYISYVRPLNEKWNLSAGLRTERTDAVGDLRSAQQDSITNLEYWSWFPSAGITWQAKPMHSFSLNYGRRINRPDYNVLNPFRNQLSELSFELGNPRLNPEIVNNIELGYTFAYRYNFKLAYSRTDNQITRLIAPDSDDERAGFITWQNLDENTVLSFNAALPFQFGEKYNAFFNLSGSFIDNQAQYPDGSVVDVQAWSYNIYTQHTFDLFAGIKGEISGWFSGPGIWGGVFEYNEQWSLNLGLQRKFLNEKLNVRLTANDIFFQSGWDGVSEFAGLRSFGSGNWDSRFVSMSMSYNIGNQNVKSRKRKTGIENEASRVN